MDRRCDEAGRVQFKAVSLVPCNTRSIPIYQSSSKSGQVDLHHLEPGLVHLLGCSFLAKESVAICDSCTLNGDAFSAQPTS